MKSKRFEAEALSAGHQKIADFITKNTHQIAFMTEQDIADQTGVSIATVSRFWKAVGYINFKEYKQQLQEDVVPTPALKMKDKLQKVADDDIVGKMIELEMNHLAVTMERLSREDFNRSVQAIMHANQIIVYGSGPSHALCELLHFRLNRFGYRVNHISRGGSELFECVSQIRENDVLIVFGFSNTPPEAKLLLDMAIETNCTSILVTDLLVSELVDAATFVLYTCRGEQQEFHSMVAPVALIDSLTIALAKQDEQHAIPNLQRLYDLRQKHASSLQYKR